MTLAQIISQYEARQPIARPPAAGALTPRGNATIAVYRAVRALRTLDTEDHAYVLALLTEELRPDLAAPVATA
jgi:hypothetical protein